MKDIQETSDIVFKAISSSGFKSYEEAERAIVMLYVPDMSFHRGGICDALNRLEKHYEMGVKNENSSNR
jgi:hypothetical protein